MPRSQHDGSGRLVLVAAVCVVLTALPSARGQLRPDPVALANVSAELIDRLRADPFTYFRFVNRRWISRVCEAFADVRDVPIVRLHGDAHVEQFALTDDAWGLVDFDDSARGPAFVDIVRYLGSIELVVRQRGWTSRRDALWDRFLEGYRRGLATPDYRPPEPDIVRRRRAQAPMSRAVFLTWAEQQMQPMDETRSKSVVTGMAAFQQFVQGERPDLAAGYFAVVRAGWLRIGVGSAATRKVLIRVQGPTVDPEDDVVLEVKEVINLDGISCLEGQTTPPAVRVIDGNRQLGRLKHDILAVAPALLIPAAADRAEHWLDWWVSNWEPSYREVRISDLRSVEDLSDIVYDSGVQLGAGEPQDVSVRNQTLSSVARLEGRLRKNTSTIVEELIVGWRELRGR
jgi:Uncharacterized protein conserved in bacteria (DUF2252)